MTKIINSINQIINHKTSSVTLMHRRKEFKASPDSVSKMLEGEVRLGGIGAYLGDEIYKLTDAETRVTVLGHVQRGAQPTHRDRLIASADGLHVELVSL